MSLFLFVTANEHERTAFETKFVRHEEKYVFGKTYYIGSFGNYPVAYIHMEEQGVTNPASTPLVSQLINELRPEGVVMVGIAFGSNENKQKIGDVLVSDKILPYDSQKILETDTGEDRTEYKEIPKEVGFRLLNAFREHREWKYYLPNALRSDVYIGSILTGSRLINNYKYREQLLNDFSDEKPIGGEMEAQGIYSAARIYGIDEWIIIKGICDWGYKKNNPNKEIDQEIAARAAVDYCFHVFSRTGVFDIHVDTNQHAMSNSTKDIAHSNKLSKDNVSQKIALKHIQSIDSSDSQNICTFAFDDTYRLDHEISSKDEITYIFQTFQEGYRIIALNGLPGCGKNYIARSFANKYRQQYPVVKRLRLKRVSDEQSLASLVISALRFDKGIGSAGTPEDQLNDKFFAFNNVTLNKLIIISGMNDINRYDIESLLELDASFILCMEKSVSHSYIKQIKVKNISHDDAVKLFQLYNDMNVQDEMLKDVFEMIEYHMGTIIFMAKLMQQHALSISDVRDKFNTREISEMPTDTGVEIRTLTEYLNVLFSFDNLLNEEVALLTLLALLPAKDYDKLFLEKTFECTKNKFQLALIHLAKKGYITHDTHTQTVKCPFLVGKAFLEFDLFNHEIAKTVLSDIRKILDYTDCNEYSIIEEKVKFGVVAAEKLISKNAFNDATLCLKIANGFKDLCFIDEAQKYAEMSIELRKDKETILQAMHLKVDIMIFRFDYSNTVDYLQSQINQLVWKDFTSKEKGEILYKIGSVYAFLKLPDKTLEYFKRVFMHSKKVNVLLVSLFVLQH